MARRGGPRRSAIPDEYMAWRRAEQEAAALNEPWAGRVDDVAEAMAVEPVTVTRWRRTVPEMASWRAWLHDTYDQFEGMAATIDRGELDAIGTSGDAAPRTQADYLSEMVVALADGLTVARGDRPSTAELARMLDVSERTVRRYRRD